MQPKENAPNLSANVMTGREQLVQYAAVVWAAGELIEIRALPQERDGAAKPVAFWLKAETVPNSFEQLEALNVAGFNIYAGVLPRTTAGGSKDTDCLAGHVIWADFDDTTLEQASEKLQAVGCPEPSMVVNSGHGCHLFWGLKEAVEPTALCGLVKEMAVWLGSDESVANPSRILRLPGFTNLKPPVAPCVLMHADPLARQGLALMRFYIPSAAEQAKTPQKAPENKPTPTDLVERARRYVAMIPGASLGERDNTAYRVALKLVNDFALSEQDSIALLSGWDSAANNPSLATTDGADIITTIVRNAKQYAKKPLGNKTVWKRPERPAPKPLVEVIGTPDVSDMRVELEAQQRGERQTIPLPWNHLTDLSQALKPGTVCVIAGPPGVGKSFFIDNIAYCIHRQQQTWRYLPLEGKKTDLKFRFLALLAGEYAMIDENQQYAEHRRLILEEKALELSAIVGNICENPRVGKKDAKGKTVVPVVPAAEILKWLDESLKTARVVFVDPISQIDFIGREQWKGEQEFIRKVIGLVSDTGGTVCLVAHTVKRPGQNANIPLSLEDVQGSTAIVRLCDCALMLEAHDEKISTIWRPGKTHEDVKHNRTVLVAKASNARGGRQRIAFQQGDIAPTFEERGVIAPKQKGEQHG